MKIYILRSSGIIRMLSVICIRCFIGAPGRLECTGLASEQHYMANIPSSLSCGSVTALSVDHVSVCLSACRLRFVVPNCANFYLHFDRQYTSCTSGATSKVASEPTWQLLTQL